MQKSENLGMQTFDGALFHLYQQGKITLDEALKNADSKNNLRLKITLAEGEDGGKAANENRAPDNSQKESSADSGGLSLSLEPILNDDEKSDEDDLSALG
jgi:twitching motility protein PilU